MDQNINPGIYVEQQKKNSLIEELKTLIHDATFIPNENEQNWIRLLPYFSDTFLAELKQIIIHESLRHLSTKNIKKQ